MAGRGGRIAVGLLVLPAAVAGLTGCSKGSGQPASASDAAARAASVERTAATRLKGALLTQVNGVAAVKPASSGEYPSVTTMGKQAGGNVQVTPKACAGSVIEGFNQNALTGAPAAAVTFQLGTNGVSEVLIAPSAKSASSALEARLPAECSRYEEKVSGKTYTYRVTEQAVTGVGKQAKVMNVQQVGASSGNQWSLIYRGVGFVGSVTVAGPDASRKAVQELGEQAYAFAEKTLS